MLKQKNNESNKPESPLLIKQRDEQEVCLDDAQDIYNNNLSTEKIYFIVLITGQVSFATISRTYIIRENSLSSIFFSFFIIQFLYLKIINLLTKLTKNFCFII